MVSLKSYCLFLCKKEGNVCVAVEVIKGESKRVLRAME